MTRLRLTAREVIRRWVVGDHERAQARALPLGEPVVDGRGAGDGEDEWVQVLELVRDVPLAVLPVLRVHVLGVGEYVCACRHPWRAHDSGCCACDCCDCRGFSAPVARAPSHTQVAAVLGLPRRMVTRIITDAYAAVTERIVGWAAREEAGR